MTPQFVYVPVDENTSFLGVIIGREWDEQIGQSVWLIRFQNNQTARLPEEHIHRIEF